jgi:hypothetical protein
MMLRLFDWEGGPGLVRRRQEYLGGPYKRKAGGEESKKEVQ